MWEKNIWDWNKKGIDGAGIPYERVLKLVNATTEEQATEAYWELDGFVCANGVAYEASINVVRLLLISLPSCSIFSKKRCLELLGQISVCESAESSRSIVDDCLREIKDFSWYFLYGLKNDSSENISLYVDLIGSLAEKYDCFAYKAKMYLDSALTREVSEDDRELVKNTLLSIPEKFNT